MANSRLARTCGQESGPPSAHGDVKVASRAPTLNDEARMTNDEGKNCHSPFVIRKFVIFTRPPRPGRPTPRHGFTLVELIAAAAMLAVLLATTLKMLHVLGDQQQAADRRALAEQAVEVVGEQIGNLPWDQLTTEAAKRIAIPAPLESHLPGAKLEVSVEAESAPVASKRIRIELTWKNLQGQPSAPVRLTCWAFPDSPSKP
jgi:prepilin-type N-terminal cleavage/methylation domain-containing protein